MSIEVGGNWGLNSVWRDKTERWNKDCVGAKKKQGPTVMCWGMIGWGWKGPFHVWIAETDEERDEAIHEIVRLNSEAQEEEDRLNSEWRASDDWGKLKAEELAAARKQRAAEKGGAPKAKVAQTWRGKKFRIQKIKRGYGRGVDAWRYVRHVARPLLWPECHRRLALNPDFV